MLIAVEHATRFRYTEDVVESQMELRLRPASGDGQRVLRYRLDLRPEARIGSYVDGFGNHVEYFNLVQPHDRLDIVSHATVETGLAAAPSQPADLVPADFLLFRGPVLDSPGVRRLARAARLEDAASAEAVEGAMERLVATIARNFRYTPDATTVGSDVNEVLETRRGVCQDFAHLLIGAGRAVAVPCRYVSGYVYDGGGEPVVGASHAWVEAWVPGRGWRSYDPTHAGLPQDRYVRLTVGRDYHDAAPTRGVYVGSATSDMEVRVVVRPLTPRPAPGRAT